MILISCTYSIITEESAELCSAPGAGFLWEDVGYTFKELVSKIIDDGFINPSSYPANGNTWEWLSNETETYTESGDEETLSIHYSHNNNERSAKYWRKAFHVAGIIKDRHASA